jgi:uncharacterized protein YegJ (DUF2314 family)
MSKYQSGDYVKVEFPDEVTGVGEWMWVRVDHADDEQRLVFGVLDNEPLNNYSGKIKLGSQLAISYDRILDHKSSSDFTS